MDAPAAPPMSLVSGEVTAAMISRAMACPPGAFVEVGVYQGGTAWHVARAAADQARPCYLYDTFEGIPYRGELDSHAVGDFRDTSLEQVQRACPTAIVVPGLFPGSARAMGPVAFVHLDCDQEQSYAEALAWFDEHMVEGGLIWCDDACLEGAKRAIRQHVDRHALPTELVLGKVMIHYRRGA